MRMHLMDGYEGMVRFNTTNEQALRQGLVETLKDFKDRSLPTKDTEPPLMMFKLVGDREQIDMFKTRFSRTMGAVYPGWLSCLAPVH